MNEDQTLFQIKKLEKVKHAESAQWCKVHGRHIDRRTVIHKFSNLGLR